MPNSKSSQGAWIPGPTAILVVHGIGNQEPLQTLDLFGRGICEEFRMRGNDLELIHGVAPLSGDRYGVSHWLRLQPRAGGPALDLFEYYWADVPQDRAPLGAIQKWLDAAVHGARTFYEGNQALVETYETKGSPFFRKGKFNYWRYWWFLFVVGRVIPLTVGLLQLITKGVGALPVVGQLASGIMEKMEGKMLDALANVVGDVVVFNSIEARSPFLTLRNRILTGCVDALRSLVEPVGVGEGEKPTGEDWRYQRVVVAGHSLGSQVAFEAINRLNVMVAAGQVRGVDREGWFTDGDRRLKVQGHSKLGDLLCGFITFGSPLDKVAFFFRERAGKDELIRRQMLDHVRCFKQKPWNLVDCQGMMFKPPIPRLLDQVCWVNYFDRNDPVSGSLDYFGPLENRMCTFAVKYPPGVIRALLAGSIFWAVVVAMVVLFGLVQVLTFDWSILGTATLWDLIRGNAMYLTSCLLFLAGTLILLCCMALFLCGNFTHLRYWDRCQSPLYKDMVDEFLLVERVDPQETGEGNTGDVA